MRFLSTVLIGVFLAVDGGSPAPVRVAAVVLMEEA